MAKNKVESHDLSGGDLALKKCLELCVEMIVQHQDENQQIIGLIHLRDVWLRCKNEIRASTSSLTLVPKPLKFLRPHYGTLKAFYETMATTSKWKTYLAEVLSVLAITMADAGERESLKYTLLGLNDSIGSWGHEYIRNLTEEIVHEYKEKQCFSNDDVYELVDLIVTFYIEHNSEYEAVDLFEEVELIGVSNLKELVGKKNFKRTCLYLTSLARYLFGPAGMFALNIAFGIYLKFEEYPNALQIALFLDYQQHERMYPSDDDLPDNQQQVREFTSDDDLPDNLQQMREFTSDDDLLDNLQQVREFTSDDDLLDNLQHVRLVFISCTDVLQKKQLCYILARHGITCRLDEQMAANEEDRKILQDIINNCKLSEGYLTLARDIEVMEPKSPEDIYKERLLDGRTSAGASVNSAKQNLAATFVNAFVNAGFGQDTLMTIKSDSSSSSSSGNWLFKNKEHGKTSAVASLGMILLWDVDSGLAQLDKYFCSNNNHVIAGALLGVGIVNCRIKNDYDPAMALLGDYTNEEDASIRIGANMGLGIAYAGSQNEQLRDKLVAILSDAKSSLDVTAFTAISLGLIYVGSCNKEVAQAIISALMNRSEPELEEPLTRLLPLGLGLLYLGKQHKFVEAAVEVTNSFNGKIRKYCELTLLSCAYAGTGNVLMVQNLLEHLEKGEMHQGFAVLGIAMVAMAEEIGIEMGIRALEHLLQYGEQNIRRAVPLALGLLCISNPKVNVMNTLSKLSHDTDSEVAMAAVISFGLIGAGTNNARIAGILCNLSSYYYKDTSLLFCVRIAQGLVHLGKGLLTLNPYHSDRFLLSPTALAGLVITLQACLDIKSIVLGKYTHVLYFLVLAMQPRMLLTVDENLKPLSVPVRVGHAVDARQAGHPKKIPGFQTHIHSTPVLLADGERAELATEKYIPLSPILEGFVILKEKQDYRNE